MKREGLSRRRPPPPSTVVSGPGAAACVTHRACPEPWVDRQVERVDDEVDDQHGDHQHHDHRLHGQQLPPGDGVDEQRAQAGNDEHPLDHHRADQQRGELQAEHRHDRHGRVAQTVLDQRLRRPQPLGPGRAQVVLPQHVEHRGAHVAGQHRALHQRQRHRGQHQPPEELHRVLRRWHPAAGGQPAQADREDGDQHDAGQEGGDGDADLGHPGQRDTVQVAVPHGHPGAHRHGDDEGQDHRRQHQPQRDAETVGDLRSDGRLGHILQAGVEGEHAGHPVEILHHQRPVQAVVRGHLCDRGVGGVDAQRHPGRVAGQHLHEAEDDQRARDEAENEDAEAVRQAQQHDVVLLVLAGSAAAAAAVSPGRAGPGRRTR